MNQQDLHKGIGLIQEQELYQVDLSRKSRQKKGLMNQYYSHQAQQSSWRQTAIEEQRQHCQDMNQALGGN